MDGSHARGLSASASASHEQQDGSPPQPRRRLTTPEELMALVSQMSFASGTRAHSDTLDLCHKNIQEIPSEFIDVIKQHVMRLALGYNSIYALPASFLNLDRLRYLNVRTNIIASFPQVLCQMPSLEILDISRNKIRTLPADPGSLVNLRVLCLSHNRIQRLPYWVTAMERIRILKVDDNPVQYPPPHVSIFSPANASEAPRDDRDRRRAQDKAMQAWITRLQMWIKDNGDPQQDYRIARLSPSEEYHYHHTRAQSSLTSARDVYTPPTTARSPDAEDGADDSSLSPNATSSSLTSPERSFRMRPLMLARQQQHHHHQALSTSSSSTTPTTSHHGHSNHGGSISAPPLGPYDFVSPTDSDSAAAIEIRGQRAHRIAAAHNATRRYGHYVTDSEGGSSSNSTSHSVLAPRPGAGGPSYDGDRSATASTAALSYTAPDAEPASSVDSAVSSKSGHTDSNSTSEDNGGFVTAYDIPNSEETTIDALSSSAPSRSGTLDVDMDPDVNSDATSVMPSLTTASLPASGSDGTLMPPAASPSRSVTPTPANVRNGREHDDDDGWQGEHTPPPGHGSDPSRLVAAATPSQTAGQSAASSSYSATPRYPLTTPMQPSSSAAEMVSPKSNPGTARYIVPPQSSLALQPALGMANGGQVNGMSSLPSFERLPRPAPPAPTALASHGRNNSHSYGQAISPLGQTSPPSARRRLLKSKKSLPDMRSAGATMTEGDNHIERMPAMPAQAGTVSRDTSSQAGGMTRDYSSQSGYASSSQHSTSWSLASSYGAAATAAAVATPAPLPTPSTKMTTPTRPSPSRPRLQHAATVDGVGAAGTGLPLLPAVDPATQAARKASAPPAPQTAQPATPATVMQTLHESPAQVLEQRRADVMGQSGPLTAVDATRSHSGAHLDRLPSRRRRALLGAAGLSDDEGPTGTTVGGAIPRASRAIETATTSQEFQRDSYFKRFSTFHTLLSAPTVTATISPSVLKTVDATRGILFALSQIYTALKQYTLFARDERVAAQLGRVLDVAAGTLASLIDALDRFDAFSLRGQTDAEVTAMVLDSSRDSIQIFRKVVSVLQLQLKPLQASADVRYTRGLILMLYGAMTEVSQSWREICRSREGGADEGAVPATVSQNASRLASTAHLASPSSNGVPPIAVANGANHGPSLPSIAESTSPVGSLKGRAEQGGTAVYDDSEDTQQSATPSRSRPQRKRHAGSFSAQDVRSGSLMSAALSSAPPLPDDALEYRGPPPTRRPLGRRVATDTGPLTQGQQQQQASSIVPSSSAMAMIAADPSTPVRFPLQQHRSVSNPQLASGGAFAGNGDGLPPPRGGAMHPSRPIVDHHLLSLVQQVTSTASGVWVALLEHLTARGVRGHQQYASLVVSGIGSPDATPMLGANGATRSASSGNGNAASLSPPPDSKRPHSPYSSAHSASGASAGGGGGAASAAPHSSSRKLHELREQCLSAAELTRRLQHTWEKVQDEVENAGGASANTHTQHGGQSTDHSPPGPGGAQSHSRALNVNPLDARRLLDESVTFARAVTGLLMSVKSLSITHESLTAPELKRALGSLTAGCTNLSVHLHFCAPLPVPAPFARRVQAPTTQAARHEPAREREREREQPYGRKASSGAVA